jgi:hypothetical protein
VTKASDNAYPSILITEGTEPSAPAAGKQRLYIDSTTHHLMRTNSSGTETDIEAASGSTGAWTTYTPTWTAPSVNPAIGNGTLQGAYLIVGKTYHFRINVIMGSTTTFGTGRWDFGLGGSVTSVAVAQTVSCYLFDNSATVARGVAAWVPGSAAVARPVGHDGTINGISSTVPWTWATSDQVIITGVIEIA